MIRSSVREATSTTATRPANSQVKTAVRPSAVKSAWSMPPQSGIGSCPCSCPGVRVVEDEGLARLGDGDRRAAVGPEVHVVRVDDRDAVTVRAGPRVDRRDRVPDVVGRVEHLHVVGGDDVLDLLARRELVDLLERGRVDDPDLAGPAVRHVDQRPRRRPRRGSASRRRPRSTRWPGRPPAACPAARPPRAWSVRRSSAAGSRDDVAVEWGAAWSASCAGAEVQPASTARASGRPRAAHACLPSPGPLLDHRIRPPCQPSGRPGKVSRRVGEDAAVDDRALLRTAADRLEALAARTTAGDWRAGGLLATRPEVIAHRERRTARSGPSTWPRRAPAPRAWIAALSPAVGPPLAGLAAARRPTPPRSSRRLRPWRGCCSSDCPERAHPAERLVDREHERDEEDQRRRARSRARAPAVGRAGSGRRRRRPGRRAPG